MNSSKSWDISIDDSVYKEMKRIPIETGKRIIDVIEDRTFDPYAGDIRKVKGEQNVWARRIGDYRIFYTVYQMIRTVNVFHAERRNTQTYRHGKQKR
ncbi:MAG: hypothetical protein COV10_04280 [Candidatus Vogelbacteria bacterium CG10_big_fil_rev_8_21_14_0_10_51_16]|uniref:Type II toxin-antitoxin system RelE/ParE family toxin n=1 Tax=Candidatus Vogelbacteria bacterium CG10_big_fil_rev_8_21_14_0_10_51_16 TaxID=1975045 RepID=A0A2H0RDG8_9BACT|nr:MAG: hypothetical protein COV10_04280 [Candidatus Vogelbacteria bacterium CG10_big_fil_rev_8_21_14_0_10_51_16]